jgi:ribosomal protein L37AE/L43A
MIMSNIELGKFYCFHCGINIFINGQTDLKYCPYCHNSFKKSTFKRGIADQYDPPSAKEIEQKNQQVIQQPAAILEQNSAGPVCHPPDCSRINADSEC